MRISEVQNFALNSLNKCCKPRKSNENISSNNSLERSPMMDTVSFGKFDQKYYPLVRKYVFNQLFDNIPAYDALRNATYVNLEPTEETIINPKNGEYKLELISCKTFRPDFSQQRVDDYDGTMRMHIRNFNEMHGYKAGWEKHLSTTEDLEKAAALAEYLECHGYIQRDDSLDPMNDMSKWCYDHLAQ